jgi:anti-sigma factor RsiW
MSDITCAKGVALLADYLEGTLSADVRAAVEAHVAGCPRCVAFIESYGDVPRVLRDASARTLPAHVQQALMAFLRSERRRQATNE